MHFYCFEKWRDHHVFGTNLDRNRFFFIFPDSHSNTHSLTPLHLATRIEAAKRHWRVHWACRLTLAHPEIRAGGGPPQQAANPRCLGQFTTPTSADCTANTLETSGWVMDLLHGFLLSLKGVFFNCSLCQHCCALLPFLMGMLCCSNLIRIVSHSYYFHF